MQRRWVVSPDYRAVIAAIAEAREALGVSERELARRLSKPPSSVNKLEQLERRLDVLKIHRDSRGAGTDRTSPHCGYTISATQRV